MNIANSVDQTNKPGSVRGFSIVEVMMSVALLALGLMAMSGMQILGVRGNAGGEDTGHAIALASAKINELSSIRYSQNPSSGDVDFDNRLTSTGGSFIGGLPVNQSGLSKAQVQTEYSEDQKEKYRYTLEWKIEDCSNLACTAHLSNAVGSWKRVAIRVQWTDRAVKDASTPAMLEIVDIPIMPRYARVTSTGG